MQHKLINTSDYLLIVDDSEIKEDCYALHYHPTGELELVSHDFKYGCKLCKKIIAHLPLNNSPILEGVDLLPPVEDEVDKLARQFAIDESYGKISGDLFKGFIFGYNKAKEKYKYTEEDLRKVIDKTIHSCNKAQKESYGELVIDEDEIIQSLQQPKMPVGFKCEMDRVLVNGYKNQPSNVIGFVADYELRQKTTTNSQGLTQWVGEYIY
jgi:hypothetical protein